MIREKDYLNKQENIFKYRIGSAVETQIGNTGIIKSASRKYNQNYVADKSLPQFVIEYTIKTDTGGVFVTDENGIKSVLDSKRSYTKREKEKENVQ